VLSEQKITAFHPQSNTTHVLSKFRSICFDLNPSVQAPTCCTAGDTPDAFSSRQEILYETRM